MVTMIVNIIEIDILDFLSEIYEQLIARIAPIIEVGITDAIMLIQCIPSLKIEDVPVVCRAQHCWNRVNVPVCHSVSDHDASQVDGRFTVIVSVVPFNFLG